jgi:hypothetical protein
MTLYKIIGNFDILFQNTEKERYNENIIIDVINFIEFNGYSVDECILIDKGFREINGSLYQFKTYNYELGSLERDLTIENAKDIALLLNKALEGSKYIINATKVKYKQIS